MPEINLLAPHAITFQDGRAYPVVFRPLAQVPERMEEQGLRKGRCLIVTDENVAALYRSPLETALKAKGWEPRVEVLPAGEATKSNTHLHRLYDAALAWGIDRKTPVLALGGGVVGDLAGFAAATLLRGIPLVQLPTSLIAQVDSALGGKTGINHHQGKNLIGAFHQPAFVCCDTGTLNTLPFREWTSGLAEVLKHALIADTALFGFLEQNWTRIIDRDPDVVREMVYRAAAVKVHVVSEDEREQGRRAILNFGHTFGHAIERVAGYGLFTHGEAVALGMRAALHLSAATSPEEDFTRADQLLQQLPIKGDLNTLPTQDLMAAMRVDKKVEAGQLRFVVLKRLGEAYVLTPVAPQQIEAAWAFAKQQP